MVAGEDDRTTRAARMYRHYDWLRRTEDWSDPSVTHDGLSIRLRLLQVPAPFQDPPWIWFCRVCGLDWGEEAPWGHDGHLSSFDICPCCWVTAGYEDNNPAAALKYRAEWLARGAPWSITDVRHDGLTTEERLTHVPPGFE